MTISTFRTRTFTARFTLSGDVAVGLHRILKAKNMSLGDYVGSVVKSYIEGGDDELCSARRNLIDLHDALDPKTLNQLSDKIIRLEKKHAIRSASVGRRGILARSN